MPKIRDFEAETILRSAFIPRFCFSKSRYSLSQSITAWTATPAIYPQAQGQLVCRAADYRQAERLPCRPQRAGRSNVFSACKAACRNGRRNGSPQSRKPDALGAENEQSSKCRYGNRFKRAYLPLEMTTIQKEHKCVYRKAGGCRLSFFLR